MSHLACDSDKTSEYNKYQLSNFLEATSQYPKIKKSLAASGGIFLGQEYHFDLVRPGAAIYGIGSMLHPTLKNPVTLLAPVIQVKQLSKNELVGYGTTAELQSGSTIVTIPIGYGDGFFRFFSNNSTVHINGKPAKVVGRVSMDLVTIDASGHDVKVGDMVQIIGDHNTPDKIAESIGTIGYEIITSLNYGRFKRIYI